MSRVAPLIVLSAIVLLSSTATAFNITRLLERYPQFSEFNQLLTRTKLADEINSRRTITVLVVNNDNIGSISGKSEDVQKRILSNHVVLDYFDQLKLSKVKENKTVLTTLYQASGTADERQGFLKVENKDGSIMIGSDMRNAPLDSKYESSVAAQPYNISVISISQPIVAPGIDGSMSPSRSPSAPTPTPAKSAPAPSVTTSQAPTTSTVTTQAPTTTTVTTQAPAPSPPPADTPAADAAAAPAPKKSNAAIKVSGVSLGLAAIALSLLAAH